MFMILEPLQKEAFVLPEQTSQPDSLIPGPQSVFPNIKVSCTHELDPIFL